MHAVRIGASRVADGIDLIDVFRAAGFESGLAASPGTWDVDVVGSLEDVASILLGWMTRNGRELMVAHVGERTYLVAQPVAALVA